MGSNVSDPGPALARTRDDLIRAGWWCGIAYQQHARISPVLPLLTEAERALVLAEAAMAVDHALADLTTVRRTLAVIQE